MDAALLDKVMYIMHELKCITQQGINYITLTLKISIKSKLMDQLLILVGLFVTIANKTIHNRSYLTC